MLTIKETGVQYPRVSLDAVNFAKSVGHSVAWVTRPLTYTTSIDANNMVVKTYVDDITNAEIGDALRLIRDLLLAEIDWVRSRHSDEKLLGGTTTLTEQQYLDYLGYVQAMRDVPTQAGFPTSVVWPVSPVQQ